MYNNHQLQTLFLPSEQLIRRKRSTGFSALEPKSSKNRIHKSFPFTSLFCGTRKGKSIKNLGSINDQNHKTWEKWTEVDMATT